MIEISIVVAVYNVEKYIDKCIKSIINQSFNNFELIIVDDGSTDKSGKICDIYAEKDSRIRVIHEKNQGLSMARNNGLYTAKGKYISFIDGDDFIHKDMYKVLYENIINEAADIALCNFEPVIEDDEDIVKARKSKVFIYNNKAAVKEIVEKNRATMIVAWGKLYKRSLFEDLAYPKGMYHEDEFVTYKLLYKASKVVETTEKLYYYLQRKESITGSKYSLKRLDKLKALKEAITFFQSKMDKELIDLAIYRYMLNLQIAYYRIYTEIDKNNEILKAIKKEYDQYYVKYRENIRRISLHKKLSLYLYYKWTRFYCRGIQGLMKLQGRINKK